MAESEEQAMSINCPNSQKLLPRRPQIRDVIKINENSLIELYSRIREYNHLVFILQIGMGRVKTRLKFVPTWGPEQSKKTRNQAQPIPYCKNEMQGGFYLNENCIFFLLYLWIVMKKIMWCKEDQQLIFWRMP